VCFIEDRNPHRTEPAWRIPRDAYLEKGSRPAESPSVVRPYEICRNSNLTPVLLII